MLIARARFDLLGVCIMRNSGLAKPDVPGILDQPSFSF